MNINPQSAFGTGEIISDDGAVLYGQSVTGYSGKTGDKTMAAKLYADIAAESSSRRYTTFADATIDTKSGTGVSIDNYLKHTPGTDGDRISTFFTEYGIQAGDTTTLPGVNDFACIVITNSDNVETTNLINRYIQLVTNTATDYTDDYNNNDDYFDINVQCCQYDRTAGKFKIVQNSPALRIGRTSKVVSGSDVDYNQFQIVGSDKDASVPQFTLLDVQFKDPLNTNNIAYHLYVPVYTIKQIEVDFYASAMTGSSSLKNPRSGRDYQSLMSESGRDTLIDSLDTWVTQFIRYRYHADDINTLLTTGNINWHYDKRITFANQYSGYTLPSDTFMVLVDPNRNEDVSYYADGLNAFSTTLTVINGVATGQSDLILDLNRFTRDDMVSDGEGGITTQQTSFQPLTINDLVAKEITESSGTSYTDDEANADHYDVYRIDANGDAHYYRYTSDGSGEFDLSVPADATFDETYYISMYVPTPNNYDVPTTLEGNITIPAYRLFYYEITPPDELTGVKTAKLNNKFTYNMMIANLFEQNTDLQYGYVVGPEERQMTQSEPTLTVNAKCSITLKNVNAEAHLRSNGRHLYHAFNIMLNRYESSGITNDIRGGLGTVKARYDINREVVKPEDPENDVGVDAPEDPNEGTVSPRCKLDQNRSTYLNFQTTDVLSAILSDTNKTVTVYADISIPFLDVDKEFPPGSSMESNIGVNVATTSNLSYYREKLAYTSMSKAFPDSTNYYYVEDINNATLDYNAIDELDDEDITGEKSFNYSKVGINGRSDCVKESTQGLMSIPTQADYIISSVENAEEEGKNRTLRIELSLEQKQNVVTGGVITGAKYEYVDPDQYIQIQSVVTGNNNNNSFTSIGPITTDGKIAYVYEIDNPKTACTHLQGDVGYSFQINVKAKTGANFTEYANYSFPKAV